MKTTTIAFLLVTLSVSGFYSCRKTVSGNHDQIAQEPGQAANSGGGSNIGYSVQNDWIKFHTVQDWLTLLQVSEADKYAIYAAARNTGNYTSTMDVWLDTLGTTQSICANYQDTKDNADSVFNTVLASFLNQDGIVQVGSFICKIDQVQKRCLVLNETDISEISDLRNGIETGSVQKFLPESDMMMALYGVGEPGPSPDLLCDPYAPDGGKVKEYELNYADKRRIKYGAKYQDNFLVKSLSARSVSQKKGLFGIWSWVDRNMIFKVYHRKGKRACASSGFEYSTRYPYTVGQNPVLWPWRRAIIYDDAYNSYGAGGQLSKYWWDGQVVLLDWSNITTARFEIKYGY
ncbi:MAG: hypothetical protein V4722_12330 [Bacteroidota bacterium]